MKRLSTLIFLFLILFSCEKEQNVVNKDYQNSSLIRQIGETEDFMQIFTYHNTGKIYEYLQRFSYHKYIYNENEQLVKIEIAQSFNPLSCAIIPGTSFTDGDDPRKAPVGQYFEFEYTNNNKIKRKSYYFMVEEKPQLMNYEKYEYTNNNVTRINFFNVQDELTQFTSYEYDINKNVIVEDRYYFMIDSINATLDSHKTFEYDTMLNPYRVFAEEGSPGRNTNANNITKEITHYFYDGQDNSNTIEYQYEYNTLGYPVLVNNIEYIYGEDE